MATRLLSPRWQHVGPDGRPAVGAKLYTYVSGTSTPKPVYSDAGLTIAYTNPILADDRGAFPPMFTDGGDYKTVIEDAAGGVIWTDDPVSGTQGGGTGSAVSAMRNRIVNGGMQISQENGTTAVNCTDGSLYTLDQWIGALSATPGGTLRIGQEVLASAMGNQFRLLATVQVADAALSAGDFYSITTPLMGSEVAGAMWGGAARKQVILRFGVRATLAGTYCVSVTNSAGNRSWVGTYTIAADEVGVDQVRTLIIPGDASGTWLTTTGIGMTIRWCLGAGTTYQGAAGWQAGNILCTSSQVNFMGTGGGFFRLFDAGLYVDDATLGEAPAYEPPDPTLELVRCLPFWRWAKTSLQFPAAGVAALSGGYPLSPPMRATPTITMTSTVAFRSNVDAAYPITSEVATDSFTASIISYGAGDTADRGRVWKVNSRL